LYPPGWFICPASEGAEAAFCSEQEKEEEEAEVEVRAPLICHTLCTPLPVLMWI
jgi:hypothetical protein